MMAKGLFHMDLKFYYLITTLMHYVNKGCAVDNETEFIVASFSPLLTSESCQVILQYNSSETINATVMSKNKIVPFIRSPGHFNQSKCVKTCLIYTERFINDVATVVSSENVLVLGSICSKPPMPCKTYQVYPIKSLLRKYEVNQRSNFTSCSIVSSANTSSVYFTGNISELVITSRNNINQLMNDTMRFDMQRLEILFVNKSGKTLPNFHVHSSEPVSIFCGERNASGNVVSIEQVQQREMNESETATSLIIETTTLTSKGKGPICNETTTLCPCPRWSSSINKGNITKGISDFKKTIEETLTLNKTELSSYRRKKTSARDDRPSSQGLGYFGAIIITCVVIFIVFEDFLTLLQYLDNKRRKHFSSFKRKFI